MIAQGTDVDSRSNRMMDPPDLEPQFTRRGAGFWLRAITVVLIVPALVVIAWAAFGLQGYQNDPGTLRFAGAFPPAATPNPTDLLKRYEPRLHYNLQEQYFADSAAEATDGPEIGSSPAIEKRS